ncbi:glycerol kinase [Thalassoporum mexicanum PCC 7367]|uniref:glycerol kinase GlpK n=1 Tax=Thalassoporum mexicanum TaxID=3457544 RepID=UPI00029FFC9D|nr:glycerol kinase GlpK [Pseudanabaena sp. PCC 7367]AFY69142.1 glycerol kinase [Pseudanabaena sp. PCC 7367]
MTDHKYVLALDLGTTGNRAILFDKNGNVFAQEYKELTQHYPQPGWLEHDPIEIWQGVLRCMQRVVKNNGVNAEEIAAIGLTVQRETCLLWDKNTGEPLHNAIVWQDRRTAPMCKELAAAGHAADIRDRTGLVLDAYFSATKLAWLLNWVKEHKPEVDLEQVQAGTVDTWVLWNLTKGVHATDHSNASRTMLMNLGTEQWDYSLLELFNIPPRIMPKIQPSMSLFGQIDAEFLGAAIPVMAIFGDQQASLFAHGGDQPGMLKCTYGTGCFLISQMGHEIGGKSSPELLATVAWSQSQPDGSMKVNYAVEGAMFTTGACIQWLRDGIQLIKSAPETEAMCNQVESTNGVYFVPALSGLGAPHWDMNARGAFLGITGGVKREHMVRSVLESIAYQVKEVVNSMNKNSSSPVSYLKVDGGASQNNFLMQFQADALGIPVERPVILDATAQGAAFGAGLAAGFWDSYAELIKARKVDRVFEPGAGQTYVEANFPTWQKAVARAKNWIE